jgi:hypothetical protein
MLDEHRQALRLHLTQDAPGFGAARLVDVALTLPQLEEQRNLPPHAPQYQGLPQRQALGRHMRHEERPGGQRQPGGTDLAAFVAGRLPQAPTAGLGDVLRDPHGSQTRGQPLALAQRDGQFDRVHRLGLQELEELPAVPGGIVHRRLHLEPGQPEHLVLR